MLSIKRTGPNRIDIEFSGDLNGAGMEKALDEFVALSRELENGRMLYRIRDFHLPSFGAMVIKFSRLPELLRAMTHFERAAVITDADWIQTASELEGKLFPGLDIKGFDLDEEDEAEAWLAGGSCSRHEQPNRPGRISKKANLQPGFNQNPASPSTE
ncbi:STAS/SEC14 domain-containing protein [Microbulbifer zhoushanensis]|uniref:STAS/SEC14 domain-containing protein n=1 Tax=Microbulbifer TaxID=48073 RepID=UPI001F387793|nr:STAS/SEC14 domain-containing protein [Microbulbifer zhoushanensis]